MYRIPATPQRRIIKPLLVIDESTGSPENGSVRQSVHGVIDRLAR